MSEQHPESLTRHDPYINRRFLDMMGHPDNADVARAVTVGLAINDPERPAPAVADAGAGPAAPTVTVRRGPHVQRGAAKLPLGHYEDGDDDVLSGRDRDGDEFRISYVQGHCDDHVTEAAMVVRATAGGYLLPIEELPRLIAWLQGRLRKFRDGAAS